MKIIQLIKTAFSFQLSVFILALGISYSADSQTPLWPTSEAEWYYTNSDDMLFFGFSHYEIERDTIVLGKNSQVYSRESKTLFTGLPVDTVYHYTEGIHHIISLEDSVLFSYNFDNNEFDTLINFNANVGDVWRSYYTNEMCLPEDGESYFLTKVVNKETEIVNGVELLKFTLERSVPGENMQKTDVFYQLLGSTSGHFVYNKFCFLSDYYVESELRCFSYHEGQGDAFNYIVVDDCESIETLDLIKESEINNIIVINPVLNNTIQIKNIYPNKLTDIKLFDNLGKEIKITTQVDKDSYLILPNKQLSSGIYFCSIEFNNKQKQTIKLIIHN